MLLEQLRDMPYWCHMKAMHIHDIHKFDKRKAKDISIEHVLVKLASCAGEVICRSCKGTKWMVV